MKPPQLNVYRVWASLALVLVAGAGSALAQERPRLPSRHHEGVRPASAVAIETLPRVDSAALRADDRNRAGQIGPRRFGRTLDTDFRPSRHGSWERLPSGEWLWRLRIRSREAVSLSVGFTPFTLPPEAALYVHGRGQTAIHGPYRAEDATSEQLWTPLVRTETLILELIVPADQRPAVDLIAGHVVHGYRSLRATATQQRSGTCNLDVACPEADPWGDQVRAVGGYTLQRGQDHLLCTGVLVNSTAEDPRPLFLTAEHCVQNADQAASMVFYWNFQTAQCREPGSSENGTFPRDSLTVGAWDQTSTGAHLRARYGSDHEDNSIAGKPDLSLVEIDDAVPPRYDLYLNGWNREDTVTRESVTIHHPSGHGKRISFDEDPSRITGWARSNSGDTHLRIGNWEVGTTEAGSSGAPLFNAEKRVVGVLSGGSAGCDSDEDAEDNNQPDWYGRLAAGFNKGDYQNTTLADWLDPLDTDAQSIEGRPLAQDTIAPAQPVSFRVATVTADSVTLRWTAPGDDGQSGTADRYLLRRRTETPIRTQDEFAQAQPVSDLPVPKPAGTPQSVTVPVQEDSSYYFALVALDRAGNASPLAATTRDATPVSTLRVLRPPAPNPARQRSTVHFVVEERQTVQIELYDVLGRRLEVLFRDEVPAFQRQTVAADLHTLASGVYFLRIRGASTTRTERIAVTR